MFFIWLLCTGVTMYILHHRGHLNAFLFILAILIWPLALIASLMLPLDYWNRTPTWNRTATYGYEPVTKVTSDSHIANRLDGNSIFKD
jgi:hypothetical protein